MMLLGQVEIDAAGTHGFERAFHSESADVDVAEDDRDEEDGKQTVHDLRELHSGNVRHVEREQQQISGYRYGGAATETEPENQVLSRRRPESLRTCRHD